MMSIKINSRKAYRWILAILFILMVIVLVRKIIINRGYESAVGSYITTGGQSYLVIKKGFFRKLIINEGFFLLNESQLDKPSPVNVKIPIKYRNNRLFIFQKEDYILDTVSSFRMHSWTINENVRSLMVLEPSKSIAGDWDLIKLKMRTTTGGLRLFFHSDLWRRILQSESFSEFQEYVSRAIRSREWSYIELDPTKAPIRSFLHRVDDPGMIEYFRERYQENPSEKTLEMIRELTSRYPTDSWLRLHEVEQEALNGDVEKAGELWNKWEAENRFFPDSLLLKNAQYVSWIVFMARLQKDYPDLVHYNNIFKEGGSIDPEQVKIFFQYLFDSGNILYPEYPLVPPIFSSGYRGTTMFCYINIQVIVSVFTVKSIIDLFQGNREESLAILSALYQLGQSLRMNGYLIENLIGAQLQGDAIYGLSLYALNACESKEEMRNFHSMLERLNRIKIPMETGNPCYNRIPVILSHTWAYGEDLQNYLGAQTKTQIRDTEFQLLRMAVAAKYHLATTGDFPNSEKDFAPFLPEGPPGDAFAEGESLRFHPDSQNEFLVYGIGPDKKDDKASFVYDPTNGAVSGGDIYIRIPRERKFPFPKEGVRAANAYELLEQFPNGLPVDPFADTKLRPLSIIESTEDRPLIIFSFGPDTDEADFTPYIASSLKEKEGDFEPVPTPEPPSNASYGRSLQWVMRRSDKIPPPPGYWTLEPMYDPTNGTVSPGDIFIEIPR
jgi:hypothetical protein